MQSLIIYVDGSSRGNPGPAGIGIIAFDANDLEKPIQEISKYIGTTTNNVAEYEAFIHALKFIINSGVIKATIKLDSELVHNQITGKYRVKSSHISLLIKRINQLRSQIADLSIMLIPRNENKMANRLAQKASRKVRIARKSFKQLELK